MRPGPMSKRRQPAPRRQRWWWATGTLGLIALSAAVFWWFSDARYAPGGQPRLVLDQTVVDLGFLPFDTPARVTFTLTNAGNGTLRIRGTPPVRAVVGC